MPCAWQTGCGPSSHHEEPDPAHAMHTYLKMRMETGAQQLRTAHERTRQSVIGTQ